MDINEFGGRTAATPAAAAKDADCVFCCVGNDNDVREVTLGASGAFAATERGAVFIDNTTASTTLARELHAAAKAKGFDFLDAPVSGGEAGAQNGVLTVMVGGDKPAFERAKPVIANYARLVTLTRWRGPAHQDGQPNLHRRSGRGSGRGDSLRPARGPRHCRRHRCDPEGGRRVAANGEPLEDDERRQIRLRFRRRLDAQGPRDLPRGSQAQRCIAAGRCPRRHLLRASATDGRQPLGYVEPDRPAQPRA